MAKILMITHTAHPDKRIDQEAKSLVKQGHDLYLICKSFKSETEKKDFYQKIYNIPLNRMQQGFLLIPVLFAAKRYKEVIDKVAPDIIHAHDLMAANIARFVIPKQTKFVYDDHEIMELTRKAKTRNIKSPIKKTIRLLFYFLSKRARKKVTKKADLIIVVHDHWKKFYSEKGVNNNKLITLENFPSKKLIVKAIQSDYFVDEFITQDPRKKMVFSSAGTKVSFDFKRKIENYAQAAQELEDWVMVVFGPEDEHYKQMGVKFLAARPVLEYLACCAKCDIMLNPLVLNKRNHYASPNRIFEAALLGMRIISTKANSLYEKFGNTLIWASKNISKDEIKQILKNIEKYPRKNEIQKKAKQFTWENQESKLLENYNKLLEK